MIAKHDYLLPAGRIGVLLIHGLTGTPVEMRGVAREFHRAGYTVYALQLAGHCGSVEDLIATRWQDWYQSVIDGADMLRKQVDTLFVCGLSMGAVLALKYTASHPNEVAGVLAYSVTFRYDGWSIPPLSRFAAPWLLPLAGMLNVGRHKMFNEEPPYGIQNEVLRKKIADKMQGGNSAEAGLPGNPWPSLNEFLLLSRNVRRKLRHIHTPCLLLHASNDDISHRRNAELVRDTVSGPVEMVLLPNSYHMITIDNDRQELFQRSIAFIRRYSVNTALTLSDAL
ncbi:alpha/beta hydrolase [Pantoea coffeiphila]|uniref:alpha/beta hydrolase n=1 Tax=Pantoea coffeiphila TaxID=1465635 RepID=UPI00195FD620|nr:alpha/beta fold hydrolase [Pantoea coffeiphila]MBM7342607.1 carboxylesterase [Pantoea coffeiphila]